MNKCRNIAKILSLVLLLTNACLSVEFDIRDFGAVDDANTVNTEAIQQAIDICSESGGGKVIISGKTFVTGGLTLKSNVTLHIANGTTLQSSTDLSDFKFCLPMTDTYTNISDSYSNKVLIFAENQENIGIDGTGVIEGRADKLRGVAQKRPYMMFFSECKNVRVKDIYLKNSPFWTLHLLKCENVFVNAVTIRSRIMDVWNDDGIDINSCDKVTISDCNIQTKDDAIVLKSTSDVVCKNVTINNCILSSQGNALKLGTESNGGFENISISNCAVYDTDTAGVALEIVDGGKMDKVCVNNITMNNVEAPIFIRLGDRARPYKKDMGKIDVGSVENITISNIEATGANPIGLSITGLPGHNVKNVTLSNIRIKYKGGQDVKLSEIQVPQNPDKYPEYSMFGKLPAYGFFCRHVENLKMHNLDLSFSEEDNRPAMIFDDVKKLDIFGFNGQMGSEAEALLRFKNVQGAFIHGCKPDKNVKAFLKIEGVLSDDISVMNNDFANVGKPIIMSEQLRKDAVFEKFNRLRN